MLLPDLLDLRNKAKKETWYNWIEVNNKEHDCHVNETNQLVIDGNSLKYRDESDQVNGLQENACIPHKDHNWWNLCICCLCQHTN
jgi:hypothetical protein